MRRALLPVAAVLFLAPCVREALAQGARPPEPAPEAGAGGTGAAARGGLAERAADELLPGVGRALGGVRPGEAGGGLEQAARVVEQLGLGVDLADGTLNWKGKRFDLGDVRVVRGRFEKWLNAPEATAAGDVDYDRALRDIGEILDGRGGGTDLERTVRAWRLLFAAASFPEDGRLSESLANLVITVWQTHRKMQDFAAENRRLEAERERLERGIRVFDDRDRDRLVVEQREGTASPPGTPSSTRDPFLRRLVEAESRMKANEASGVAAQLASRLEYQSFILQLFLQRRFQHVLIANDFYRYLFSGEEQTLEGAESLRRQILGDLDVRITTTTLDALAREAMRDVRETMEAVDFHLSQRELQAATERLQEAFVLGEFLPEVKAFPRERKREVFAYYRDLQLLATAVEVRDFARAEEILARLTGAAADFDASRPAAFLRLERQRSDFALKRAEAAARQGDLAGAEAAMREATEAWPSNPALGTAAEQLLAATSVRNLAALDFDRLERQGDDRAVFERRFEFGAALAADAERQPRLVDVLKRVERVEAALAQARELSRIENHAGAWEVLERAYREDPRDAALNRARADAAVRAGVFAREIVAAAEAEAAGRRGEALARVLAAQQAYPASYFAQEGIPKLAAAVLAARRPVTAAGAAGRPEGTASEPNG